MDNILSGRYQFSYKDTLGSGSFGNVFKGLDLQTKIPVAVKVVDKEKLSAYDNYLFEALQREIET